MPVQRHKGHSGPALVFVTTTVRDWLPVFDIDPAATELMAQLRDSTSAMHISVMGYILMPSHMHALIGVPDYSQLSKFMQSFKSLSARRIAMLDLGAFNDVLRNQDRFALWMRRFDDFIVYSERQFKRKLEYIHNNPVRARLVDSADQWKYSSARDWLDGKKGPIKIDRKYSWT